MLDDLHQLRERAQGLLARGDLEGATQALLAAAAQTHVAEQDYVSVLRPLAEAFQRQGDGRRALTVHWYMALAGLLPWAKVEAAATDVPAVDRGRTLAAAGDMPRAARAMEEAGLPATAAVYREKAGDWAGARALWSRLGQGNSPSGAAPRDTRANAYEAALVQFNLARCARAAGSPTQAREATAAAVRLLEEAADHFETVGLRERAFDCFQVLIHVGKESGKLEDVLAGFVNCIRILREDHLKYFALQYFEDALVAVRDRQELSAAATLAREAADYARSLGLSAVSAHYVLVQADLWRGVARQHIARGAPPEIAENALLAAVLAFGEMGQFSRVGELYQELAALDLVASRKAHYARAAGRYQGLRNDAVETAPLPAHFRQDSPFPNVWHLDLLEWEQQGSAAEACADVILDKSWPDLLRRRALLARLAAFDVEAAAPGDVSAPVQGKRARLAELLSELQLFNVLSPLEKLYEVGDRNVRLAVLRALGKLFFKRSFATVRTALRDSDPAVVEQGARAVEALYFAHAFDPLARIVREATQADVRASALRALARIDSAEAAEFLLGVVEHGAPGDRAAATSALKRARGVKFLELARDHLTSASPEGQTALREILRERGAAP